MDPNPLKFTWNWTNWIKIGAKSSGFNQKWIEINQISKSSFNRRPISTLKSELFINGPMNSLESDFELSPIWFGSPNGLSLAICTKPQMYTLDRTLGLNWLANWKFLEPDVMLSDEQLCKLSLY